MLKCFSTCTSFSRNVQSLGVCTRARLWVRQGAGRHSGHQDQRLLNACNESPGQAVVDKIFTCYMPLTPHDSRSDRLSQGSVRELRQLGWICSAASRDRPSHLSCHFCHHPYIGTHCKYDPSDAKHKPRSDVLNKKRSKIDYHKVKGAHHGSCLCLCLFFTS